MSKKKNTPKKHRSWLAVHAHFKTGAGPHGPGKGHKQKYNRKKKQKRGNNADA